MIFNDFYGIKVSVLKAFFLMLGQNRLYNQPKWDIEK